MKERFYFTFGTEGYFPFNNTYLVVYAESYKEAVALFRKRYPDHIEGIVNCSYIYTQEKWNNLRMEIFYPEEPVKILRETVLTTNELKYINESLKEAKYFAKDVRDYLHRIKKQRSFTKKEKELWSKIQDVHNHANNSGLLIRESNLEVI